MAHPNDRITFYLFEQMGKFLQYQLGSTELAMWGRGYLTAQYMGDELHAIADAENGNSQFKQLSVTKW